MWLQLLFAAFTLLLVADFQVPASAALVKRSADVQPVAPAGVAPSSGDVAGKTAGQQPDTAPTKNKKVQKNKKDRKRKLKNRNKKSKPKIRQANHQ